MQRWANGLSANAAVNGSHATNRECARSHQQRYRRRHDRSHGLAVSPAGGDVPVVFFDALRVKIHEEAVVRSKAVCMAPGVLPEGGKDIRGIWN